MISADHMDLIQRSLDGELSPAEEASFQSLLGSDAAVRSAYDRLACVPRMISELDTVEPPIDFESSVIRQIGVARPARAHRRSWLSGVLETWSGMGRLQHGLTFAAGVAAGLLIFFAVRPGGIPGEATIDASQLTGTVLNTPVRGLAHPADSKPLELAGLTGWISSESVSGLDRLRIQIDSPGMAEITVRYSRESAQVVGFSAPAVQTSGLSVVPGTIRFQHEGVGDYALDFAPVSERGFAVAVRIEADERAQDEVINFHGVAVQ